MICHTRPGQFAPSIEEQILGKTKEVMAQCDSWS